MRKLVIKSVTQSLLTAKKIYVKREHHHIMRSPNLGDLWVLRYDGFIGYQSLIANIFANKLFSTK